VKRITLLAILIALTGLSSPDVRAQNKDKPGRGRDKKEPAAEAAAPTVTIVLDDGRTRDDVELKEEKFAALKFRERGRNDEVPGERVVEVRFKDAPPLYAGGESQLRGGVFDRAVQSFTAARNAAGEGTPIWFHATFLLGESQRGAGNHAEAITEYGRVLEKGPDHWLAPAAIYGLGQAQVGAARFDQAVTTFRRLGTGFGDQWGLRGKVGEGDALFAQRQFGPARGAYETAEGQAQRHPAIRRTAQVGIGKCYIADKRYDDAVRYFEGIISQPNLDPEVAGGAWVGMGDCRFEQARTGGAGEADPNRLKQALIFYQTAAVRYAGVQGAYPRALFQSAQIYRQLNLPELAARQEEELRSRCPRSPYVRQLPGGGGSGSGTPTPPQTPPPGNSGGDNRGR
jgi:tetratricopeptide (TPR) repeat protein